MSQSVRSTGKRVEMKGLTKDQKVMSCGQYTATQAGRTQGYSGQTAGKNVPPPSLKVAAVTKGLESMSWKGARGAERDASMF